jgi:hypothetical protein
MEPVASILKDPARHLAQGKAALVARSRAAERAALAWADETLGAARGLVRARLRELDAKRRPASRTRARKARRSPAAAHVDGNA